MFSCVIKSLNEIEVVCLYMDELMQNIYLAYFEFKITYFKQNSNNLSHFVLN